MARKRLGSHIGRSLPDNCYRWKSIGLGWFCLATLQASRADWPWARRQRDLKYCHRCSVGFACLSKIEYPVLRGTVCRGTGSVLGEGSNYFIPDKSGERRQVGQLASAAPVLTAHLTSWRSFKDAIAPRRHRCAKLGLRGSTKESGYVGDYHAPSRPGEE